MKAKMLTSIHSISCEIFIEVMLKRIQTNLQKNMFLVLSETIVSRENSTMEKSI